MGRVYRWQFVFAEFGIKYPQFSSYKVNAVASLQDQLRKAGMVDDKKAKKLSKEKRKQQNLAKHSGEKTETDRVKEAAAEALAERVARDKALAAERNQREEKKQIGYQINQLISTNKIDKGKGDISFQFQDDKKIKKIYVTNVHQHQLSVGILAIAELDESYELIPAVVARKIIERDESRIKFLNDSKVESDDVSEEDDPYADYQIPDDLMW